MRLTKQNSGKEEIGVIFKLSPVTELAYACCGVLECGTYCCEGVFFTTVSETKVFSRENSKIKYSGMFNHWCVSMYKQSKK